MKDRAKFTSKERPSSLSSPAKYQGKSMKIKVRIIDWIPPALLHTLRKRAGVRWHPYYSTWSDARQASTGYDDPMILEKVKAAVLKVQMGEAVCERDSVTFQEAQYSWPLLAGLMWVAAQSNGRLDVVDFGGSLGTTYFQNRRFLKTLPCTRWNIVEQEHFVNAGRTYLQNENLRFFHSIDSCMESSTPNSIIFSSVLQYLEKPYDLLAGVITMGFDFILLDRTPIIEGSGDLLTVQVVPDTIYSASYPCWFFNMHKLCSLLDARYDRIAEFDSIGGTIRLSLSQIAYDKGMIFKKKSEYSKSKEYSNFK